MNQLSETGGVFRMLRNYSVSSILPALVSLATTSVFTRVFSTEIYGIYAIALAVANLVRMILSQWIRQAVLRALPAALDDTAERDRLLKAYLLGIWIVVAVEVFVAAVGLSAMKAAGFEGMSFYAAASAYVVSSSLFEMLNSLFAGEMRSASFVKFKVGDSALTFLLRVFFVFGWFALGGESLFIGVVAGQLLLLPFLWRASRLPGFFPSRKDLKPLFGVLKTLFFYGYPMAIWYLSSMLLSVGDRFVLKTLMGDGVVGIYNASYNLINGVMMLMAAPINLTFHPLFMKAHKDDDPVTVSYYLEKIIRYIITLGVAMTGIALLFHEDAAKILLGEAFREGSVIFPLVVLGMTFWTASMFVHKPLEFEGKTLSMSLIGLGSAAFNIAVNFLLIPLMGYVGAAVATILSFLFYMIATMILIRRIQKIPYDFAAFAKISLPVAALLAGLYFLRRAWDPANGWTSFFVFLPPSLGIFAWIVYRLFKEKSSDERATNGA